MVILVGFRSGRGISFVALYGRLTIYRKATYGGNILQLSLRHLESTETTVQHAHCLGRRNPGQLAHGIGRLQH